MKKTLITACVALAMGICAHAQKSESIPPPPPPLPPKSPKVEVQKFTPPVIVKNEEVDAFYSRNKEVASINWKGENHIILVKKDNSKEKYDMSDAEQKKKFTEKYGEAPARPEPPPPPAPPTERKKA